MKPRLLSALAASAGLVLTSCDKPELSAPAPAKDRQAETPAGPEAEPVAAEPSETEKKLASQVQELEARELALQQQMEDERLAAAEAEIAKEQELLQKEREAWALEQQLADAKSATETPAREAPPVEASSQVVNAGDYQTFYDDLDPLGSWYESPDYGYVWQPSIAISDNSWRPYTKGRWASADQGWTWCSDEPFGWACYHYGRWAKVKGRGWVWIPGDQWAPAWVCWRKTDKYIGWCPLPPETVYDSDITYGSSVDEDCGIYPGGYVFMPVRYFDQPVYSYCEMPPVCLTIYNTSINITNVSIRRHRVECGGPQYDWISQCVRHPMPRYTLACESNRPDRRRSPLIDKDRLHCFAPKVYAPWNVALRPARTKANLAGAEVIRRSEGLSDKLLGRFQQERRQRDREADNLKGVGQKIVEHQRKLATLEKTRETIELSRRDRTAGAGGHGPDRTDSRIRPGDTARPNRLDSTNLAEAKEQLDKLRSQRNTKLPDSKQPVVRNDRTPVPQGNPPLVDSKEQARLAETRADLESRKQQLAKLRADREASAKLRPQPPAVTAENNSKTRVPDSSARVREENVRRNTESPGDGQTKEQIARQRTAVEEQRRTADAATRDLEKQTADRAVLEDQRRRQQDAENKLAKDQLAKQRDTLEQQRRAADAAARDANRQTAERAALENQRRQTEEAQNKATKEQIARQRTALEEQRRAADAAFRDAEKQKTERAALEDTRRRQQEAANEQARAQIAAQRAALEQQRRQAEEQAKADRQARDQAAAQQREAMIQQQREAMAQQQQREAMQRQAQEQAARQREAMENQRRQAEEQNRQENMRRQAEDRAREQQERRQAEEASRRQAEEQNRRQAEEANRRQAEESRRQADRAKEAADRESKRGR